MLAVFLSPVYILLNVYMLRWLLRWMKACSSHFVDGSTDRISVSAGGAGTSAEADRKLLAGGNALLLACDWRGGCDPADPAAVRAVIRV